MTSYMLAQLQLRYGYPSRFRYEAAMTTIRELFESQNVNLVAGTITAAGPLFEAWNLWQIEDQGHVERALNAMSLDNPDAQKALSELAAVVEYEQVRFLQSLPFSADHPAGAAR